MRITNALPAPGRAKPLVAFLSGVFAGSPGWALGQTDAEQVLPTVSVQAPEAGRAESLRGTEASVGSFGAQPILDTPAQVNVVTREVMRLQEARSLGDLARNDPAVTPSGSTLGFFDAVTIRGFELNNWSGYRREGLMYPNQFQVPLENKEQVEILKGVTALRYGFTNPGGVVNYVLKKPTERDLREARLFANGFGGFGLHGDIGGRLGQDRRIGYRINAVTEEERTYVDEVRGPRRMISGYFDWRLTDRLLVEADVEYQRRDLVQNTNIGIASFAPGVRPFVPTSVGPRAFLGQSWGVYPTETTTYSARFRYELSDRWSLRSAIQYTDAVRDQRAASIRAGSLQANGEFDVTTFYNLDQTRRPLGSETVLEGDFETFGIQHRVAAGFSTLDHKIGFGSSVSPVLGTSNVFAPRAVSAPVLPNAPPSILAVRQRERGVFVADTIRLSERWSVLAGVRHTEPDYRNYNTTTGAESSRYDRSAVTPSYAVLFKPQPDMTVYASYSEGLEQGGTAPVTAINANEVLTPLLSRQAEVGYKVDFRRGFSVSSALFRIDKGLEFVDAGNRYVQDGRQINQGFEVSLAGALSRQWRAVAGLMLLDAEVEKTGNAALVGKRPVNVPDRQANLFLSHLPGWLPGLTLSGGILHVGDRPVDATNTLFVPSYTRFDFGVAYRTRLSGANVSLNAYLENVTDRTYFSSVSFSQFQFGAPRSLRLSAAMTF
jgi:iron complex outermembrane receptor protein